MKLAWMLLLAVSALAANLAEIEKTMRREMEAGRVPGAAIAMVKDGQVILAKGFGVTSAEEATAVTADTLFRLGSTAKMFTAAAALSLADEGRLKLDVPIGTYAKGLHPKLAAVTMQQLLTHTAGLADDAPMDGPHDESAMGAAVRSWKDDAFFSEPGRIFSYANTGYVLAGYVIEQVTGKPFASAVEELVLRPFGMPRSTYRPLVAMTYPLALGHDNASKVIRPFADHAGAWPPGSLFASANDLARFAAALLERPLFARMSAPQSRIPGTETTYGYGLLGDRGVVMHSGARVGYGSSIHFLPAERAAVVLAANRSGALLGPVARLAVKESGRELPAPARPRTPVSMTPAEMSRYAGRYANGAIRVEIAPREGKLQIQFRGRWIDVLKVGEGRFHAPNSGELEDFWLVGDGPDFLFAALRALRREGGQ